jgi:mxaA protein
MRAALILALLASVQVCHAERAAAQAGRAQSTPAQTAVVEQPRPFGYVLGDVLTQRIPLLYQGHAFEPSSLPAPDRVGVWLTRRSSKIESGDGRRWLIIEYQLINSPQALQTVNLPALEIKAKDDTAALVVPEWPISVAPLTPRQAFAKGGLQDLRPDRPAPEIPTHSLWRRLEISSAALALTLTLWLAWWGIRYRRAAAKQPFARAFSEIRHSDDGSRQAWLTLHRAFDQTAGRALQLNTLPLLFVRAPHFESRRADIEQFYAQSSEHFFGSSARAGAAAPTTPISPRALCQSLRRLEKRYER